MIEPTPSSESASPSAGSTAPSGDVTARASRYYRNTRYLIVALLIGYGAWSIYDGFVSWPAGQQRRAELDKSARDAEVAKNEEAAKQYREEYNQIDYHSDTSILLNKVLGVLLPPLGVFMLFYSLRNSRGQFRLTPDDVLHAPGHPPVPIDAMTALDRKLWDRKGIAYVDYELDGGSLKGTIRLDDFIYERPGIDAMYDRILAKLDPEAFAAEKAKLKEKESAA